MSNPFSCTKLCIYIYARLECIERKKFYKCDYTYTPMLFLALFAISQTYVCCKESTKNIIIRIE